MPPIPAPPLVPLDTFIYLIQRSGHSSSPKQIFARDTRNYIGGDKPTGALTDLREISFPNLQQIVSGAFSLGPTQHIRFTCNDPETGAEEPIESSYDLQYWTAATRNVRHRDSFRLILKAHVTIQDEPPARDPETPAPETAGTAELPITVDDNLSPEPAFAAWWCLDQRLRKTNNSICGDEMGLGKTPIALMYWLLWVLLDGMYEEVDKSRQARDGNHLPLDSPVGSKCPSATTSKYGFECSCVLGTSASIWQENYLSEHHAAKVPLNILPFLFIVKSATVQKWCNEFTKFIDPSVAPLRLIPAYHALKKLHKATDDTSLQARRHLQDASVKYTDAIAPYMIRRLKASSWGTGRVSPLQKPKVQIIPIRLSSEDATKAKQREVQLLDQLEKRPENASGAIMTPEERKQLASAIHSSTRRAIQDNMWPSLLDLESKGLVPDVTSDYTPTRIWSKITELDLLEPSSGNRFFNNVASIAHASSKCQYILNKIESLETLPNGAHEKILIGSFDAFNAWLLYLVLNKEYGPKGVLWIHSKQPSSERAQIADRFQEPYSSVVRFWLWKPDTQVQDLEQFTGRISREGGANMPRGI
ncbi:hypothetical protein SLS57_002047 [Botryosphaeria dothidea]